jgi:hypothetical protein
MIRAVMELMPDTFVRSTPEDPIEFAAKIEDT